MKIQIELRGNDISLNSYTLDCCHEFYKNYVADSAMMHQAYVYDKKLVDHYYQSKVMQSDRIFFAIVYNEMVVGEIQLKRIDKEMRVATLSIHLNKDEYKGKGFGTQAILLILQYAILELGLQTIYADAIHRNVRSMHVLKKCGFIEYNQDDKLVYFKFEK